MKEVLVGTYGGVGGSSCHFPQFLVLAVISSPADGSNGQRGGSCEVLMDLICCSGISDVILSEGLGVLTGIWESCGWFYCIF